jgi:hypothetical protein
VIIERKEEKKGKKAEFYLIHGKKSKGEFNLHFRDPFSPFTAFGVSLVTNIKKQIA